VSDHLNAGYGLVELVPLPGPERPADSAEDQDEVFLAAAPAYPVGSLVGPLRAFVDWAVRDGLHPETAGAAGLAALATLTGPAKLRISDAKTVRAILWVALIGVASSGKSPAFEHAFARITDAYAEDLALYQDSMSAWEDAGDQKPFPRPVEPQALTIDDMTMEALGRWLNTRQEDEGDASGAAILDELADLLQSLNQYRSGRGGDVSKWLKLWTGAPLSFKRVGSGGARN
jgi:hypothetical protein